MLDRLNTSAFMTWRHILLWNSTLRSSQPWHKIPRYCVWTYCENALNPSHDWLWCSGQYVI